jgi:hypothetical protein
MFAETAHISEIARASVHKSLHISNALRAAQQKAAYAMQESVELLKICRGPQRAAVTDFQAVRRGCHGSLL